jgi:hypothetical protein
VRQQVKDHSRLDHIGGVIAELKKQFTKENLFQIFSYMHGYLDFDATTHQIGKYFLECKLLPFFDIATNSTVYLAI